MVAHDLAHLPIRAPPYAARAFTDEQIDALLRAATPLPPADRTRFLEEVAAKLEGQTLGDGLVFRAIREAQGRYLDPPSRLSPPARGAERDKRGLLRGKRGQLPGLH
jgi:hypothetical protein